MRERQVLGRGQDLDGAGGDPAAFAWSFDVETYPRVEFTTRFIDDHELEWEVGPDLRPRRAPIRNW